MGLGVLPRVGRKRKSFNLGFCRGWAEEGLCGLEGLEEGEGGAGGVGGG